MRELCATLLGARARGRLLDAGCGAGGFLRWALDRGSFESVSGVDVASAAIELARRRVPEADLRIAPLEHIPFDSGSFDVVTMNDVLQHVAEDTVAQSLAEVRRVLRHRGTLFVRTNGARHAWTERADWRVYDRPTLVDTLAAAGFRCERVTYANVVGSLLALARGRTPRAPTTDRAGIPDPRTGTGAQVGLALLSLESRYLARPWRRLPYGHTLLAVAVPDGPPGRESQ